jgi:secondary thiamine-phosphate synthase enzyme
VEFTAQSSKQKELIDITEQVSSSVAKSGVREGICLIYVPHATAGIIINEFEPNIAVDFLEIFDKLFPKGNWRHNRIDDNAEAHLKSGIVGPGAAVPVDDKELVLGTWQRILLCEFDGPRERRVVVKVVGK